ncbi:UTP--glucose-1-phosphate uridylyltransferase [Candidatus Peregrinibacteria bacterium RIFOXYC2_FULL_33_13]|nr:MAG: Glucose-1-phosphate uridylyltransferase [Candidatus Peregrinibacteria bacterium GW2011_GWA2_33_10]KKP38707.1 MAG: UTP-glucose-1-phosphate uridylyltransferase, UTP-glucose-1-phosphate uridylyltransferase [Candidatus Peregrinibacteria bacterium GW2011_GWC2_33_13]OGJ49309.1 MAG: UTP--glucose-1-phosphate uridylyltransferase [Candidatus Peregrinibacteria bacterium RIFOXYA2_FULL_33_7]OGJ51974.1 MAG: UTP--glucose-1-phosphate uridylyltransferase [Candidatus Peregrinibacteria bacterium RIFOXYC2_F
MKIRKAIFPAAGFGTRFLPATKAQPKEMLPIIDKPVIQYLVEEAVSSGIEEIIIVTGRGKRAIEDHFDYSFELEHTLNARGKLEIIKEIQEIPNLAKFVYVRQPYPLGDGHAILCAKELIGDEPFAVLFGDDVVDSEIPALKQLINEFENKKSTIVALNKIDIAHSDQYGMIKGEKLSKFCYQIEDLIEKPKSEDAPSDMAIIGKYICTPEIFTALEKSSPSHGGEIRLIDGFRELKKKQKIYGVEIQGKRYDTGDKVEFIKATIDFALKRKDLGPAIRKYIIDVTRNL